jgi:hypothetical protein
MIHAGGLVYLVRYAVNVPYYRFSSLFQLTDLALLK